MNVKKVIQIVLILLITTISSYAQKTRIIVDISKLDFADTNKQMVRLSSSNIGYPLGDSESISIEVNGLPTYIDLEIINKHKKRTVLKRIWIEQKNITIQGPITHIEVVPLSSIQSDIDYDFRNLKIGKPVESNLASKKPYLVHLAIYKRFYSADYVKGIMSELPDTLSSFWAVKDLRKYLLDSNGIAYDTKEKKFSYLTAINRKNQEQRIELTKGKYLLLDFSSPGCKPCLQGIDGLVGFNAKYKDKLDIVMLWNGLNYDDWLGYKNDYQSKITFVNLLDENGAIFKTMDINVAPTYMLFNPNGILIKTWKGKLSKDISKYFK